MEKLPQWRIGANEELSEPNVFNIADVLQAILSNLNPHDNRPMIHLGHGDPSSYLCFRPSPDAVSAVSAALHSASFNCYSPSFGILPARRAIANYLSRDLPYKLSQDDVYLTVGCYHAIEVALRVLASPVANILLPRPGYPGYKSLAKLCNLQVRFYDLVSEQGWEINLDNVEALADENTKAIVAINPGNPCGNVYTYQHLQKVMETARKLGIVVIADEVYGKIAFGSKPFVPMGTFGSIAPVLTLGSISKRWIVPGWRLGWLVTTDPNGILKKYGLTKCIESFLRTSPDPATFIQGAISRLLEDTKEDFFVRVLDILRKDVEICWERFKEIPCITCPYKPEGGMSVVVKLNLNMLDGVKDDNDFCMKLANEESVIALPGYVVGLKNWIRISFATEPTLLEEAFHRIKAFCQRHEKGSLDRRIVL